MDDEEEVTRMDTLAARSQEVNKKMELRKLFELEVQQREDELAKREEMGRSSQQHPSTTGDNHMGEEEREEDISILKAVQDQIQNHPQDAGNTPSAAAGLEDHPSTKGDDSTGEETREDEEKEGCFCFEGSTRAKKQSSSSYEQKSVMSR
ncbi:hypothetical protein SEMRO_1812_G299290.1 [Seminavis robusta]|uniref:Uncharacterized protein n=1 Tax=Seminavis robusta TaxID=568900 RepID=A0A9N8ESB8_9STRA|nr:hypothetical protein SEMRO_1812_G299290.1 [Seminavis robusta]|eukprot:Sro1812_g299290.1 n/a (150) ;mRNA; r:18174-18623